MERNTQVSHLLFPATAENMIKEARRLISQGIMKITVSLFFKYPIH